MLIINIYNEDNDTHYDCNVEYNNDNIYTYDYT